MSAAAAPAMRAVTRGYFEVPNAFVENLVLMTPAEQQLALIILRRGGPNNAVKVSDSNWESWTGLKPRAKEYAIKGLASKGLEVVGRGDKATYTFRRSAFEDYIRYTQPGQHARTAGRKKVAAVPARAGAMVHPECASKGCGMMRCDSSGSPADSTQLAQLVAQSEAAAAGQSLPVPGSNLRIMPSGSTRNAQLVAQSSPDPVVQLWPLTFSAVQSLFPLAGEVFLVRLVAAVEAVHRGVSDRELAAGVALAWKWKKRTQQAEGLFLLTVPAAISAARKVPTPEQAPQLRDGVGRLLARAAVVLQTFGDTFGVEVAQVVKLQGEVVEGPVFDPEHAERVEVAMERIEAAIVTKGVKLLDDRAAELLAAEEQAERQYLQSLKTRDGSYKQHPDTVPQSLLADLRDKARTRKILELLNCPRLSAFYA